MARRSWPCRRVLPGQVADEEGGELPPGRGLGLDLAQYRGQLRGGLRRAAASLTARMRASGMPSRRSQATSRACSSWPGCVEPVHRVRVDAGRAAAVRARRTGAAPCGDSPEAWANAPLVISSTRASSCRAGRPVPSGCGPAPRARSSPLASPLLPSEKAVSGTFARPDRLKVTRGPGSDPEGTRRDGRGDGYRRASTPAGRTRPGSTTTGSAARTTSPPTGRRPSRRCRPTRSWRRRCRPTARSWPGRCGTWPARPGIRQFLDIGTGIPTADNTHEVAQRERAGQPGRLRRQRPDRAAARPGPADQHARRARTDYIQADLRDPDAILAEAAADAGLRPAGGADAARDPALHPRRARTRAGWWPALVDGAAVRAATW